MTTVLTQLVARALLAPILVVAAAILVKGYASVGDGFAAGVVASLALLLQFVAFGRDRVHEALPIRYAPQAALVGLALAVAVLAIPLAFGGAPLEHWPPADVDPVYVGSLELVTAVVFDLGVFLVVVGAVGAMVGSFIDPDEEELA